MQQSGLGDAPLDFLWQEKVVGIKVDKKKATQEPALLV